jgi:FxLD family lantipeptide
MSPTTTTRASGLTDDADFALDLHVVEAAEPIAALQQSTSDNCGSTCTGTACISYTGDPV